METLWILFSSLVQISGIYAFILFNFEKYIFFLVKNYEPSPPNTYKDLFLVQLHGSLITSQELFTGCVGADSGSAQKKRKQSKKIETEE